MESKEFDATLGGTEHLPYSANSLKFAASRSVEIAAMTQTITKPIKTMLIFQSLPVHMRRRVMSHNAKRLPQKLRSIHLDQLEKSGFPPQQKRPSRKYRRRPTNLLSEYNRRKKNNIWLETHIWHAKRFHMIERWGHRLAYAPCDKAFRACYRATSAHCLLQDISYHTTVQINGPDHIIKEMFSSICNPACGLSVSAKAYTEGKREGSIHLYERNSYPFGYIGKVYFIWQINESNKALLLFIHPSQTKKIESLFTDLLSNEMNLDSYETPDKRRKLTNYYSENIQIKLLPGVYNRFRLTGPNSHAVLVSCLKCIDSIEKIKEDKWACTLSSELYLKEKYDYWQNISSAKSPSQLPSRIIASFVVRDPRLSRPNKRCKAKLVDKTLNLDAMLNIPTHLAQSPLWNTDALDIIKKGIMTNSKFIEHVTNSQIVPGKVHVEDPAVQSLPIVLIQRPGSQDSNSKKIGYGSGWDVIIPSGYGMPFWQTFIMFGARSGGLRETENLAFEMGECYIPPDSNAGREEEKRIESELKNKYFRLPPSKRVNYIKFAAITPFICPWNILVNDWSENMTHNYFILRDRQILSKFQVCINQKKPLPLMDNSNSCLIAIYVKMVKKGSLKRHALICMPESNDVKTNKTLSEPMHKDPNEKLRKDMKKEHRRKLKQCKKRRSKLKKKGSTFSTSKQKKSCRSEPSEYVKSMRELWLPSNITTVRQTCSRQIMGFLSQASFSFSESRCCGVGYIPYNALNSLLKSAQNQVLLRNVSSRKYRIATICIIQSH